jgi:hypothetical protein
MWEIQCLPFQQGRSDEVRNKSTVKRYAWKLYTKFRFVLHIGDSSSYTNIYFYVLLTVHLSIFILVINQLDAQNFCFTISLFHVSTCFEHHVLIISKSKLYYAAGVMIPEAE